MSEKEMLVADFSNARVGDRVKCLYRGCGTIEDIIGKSGPYFRFKVCFDDFDSGIYFDERGGNNASVTNTLFYHFEGQFPTAEACKRPLPEIEVDTKVLVRGDKWVRRYASHINKHGYIECFSFGQTSWSCDCATSTWPYWKLAEDETINSGNLEELE